jgi:hypothetical protein
MTGGSDTGFAISGAGVFVGQYLTPDKETGFGDRTSAQIIAAIRTDKTLALSYHLPPFVSRRRRRAGRRRLFQEPAAEQREVSGQKSV